MKDEKGLYYYPFPQNKNMRMYVREEDGAVCLRMWNKDDPNLWEEHGWVPYEAIRQARALYTGEAFDPAQAYDLQAARALINEDQ
jgi:hypothetical protein